MVQNCSSAGPRQPCASRKAAEELPRSMLSHWELPKSAHECPRSSQERPKRAPKSSPNGSKLLLGRSSAAKCHQKDCRGAAEDHAEPSGAAKARLRVPQEQPTTAQEGTQEVRKWFRTAPRQVLGSHVPPKKLPTSSPGAF